MNDIDYKSLYSDLEPSPWAVGRLRTRIEAMRANSFDEIWSIFTHRIAAGLAIALILVAVLNIRYTEAPYASDWSEYIGVSGIDQLASALPDYTTTTE